MRIRFELANRISVAIEAIAHAHAAAVCGVTPDSVARIERGDVADMPVAELQRIVAKFETERDVFSTRRDIILGVGAVAVRSALPALPAAARPSQC